MSLQTELKVKPMMFSDMLIAAFAQAISPLPKTDLSIIELCLPAWFSISMPVMTKTIQLLTKHMVF
jgi:hypothetical protein